MPYSLVKAPDVSLSYKETRYVINLAEEQDLGFSISRVISMVFYLTRADNPTK